MPNTTATGLNTWTNEQLESTADRYADALRNAASQVSETLITTLVRDLYELRLLHEIALEMNHRRTARRIIIENARGEYIADYVFTGTTQQFREAYNLTPKHRPYRETGTVETGGGQLLHWGPLATQQ